MILQLRLFIQALILLAIFIKVSVGANDIDVNFTKVPRNTEYFVGSEATLEWEYSSSHVDPVRKIRFGIQENENSDVVIFVKDTLRGDVKTNTKIRLDVIAPLNGRVYVVENKSATFRIANLTLNDSRRYFCSLERNFQDYPLVKTHYVDLRVVDLKIDYQKSTPVIESWEGHKITLKCAVKKVLHDAPVRFYWMQQNQTLTGRQTSWKTLGQISLVTVKDEDFEPVTCVAETKATAQRLEINIKRLYRPLEPVNLTVQEIPSNDTKCKLYNKITWEPPQHDGGIALTGYLLEFKHPVIKNTFYDRIPTNTTEHMVCKLRESGKPREVNVDVRGVNKAGRGFRSNTIKIFFFSTPSAPFNLRSILLRRVNPPFVVELSWNPPYENGGTPLVKYSLEYKVLGSTWEDGETRETNKSRMVVYKYHDSYIYQVRVKAWNIFGFGPASEVKTIYFAEKPGPPQNLKRGLVFYDSKKTAKLELSWEPPISNGGLVVSHYIVEHKTVMTEWNSTNDESVNGTKFALPVKETKTYTVRVRAVTSLGPSEASDVLNITLTEKDVRTLARSNNSGSLRATRVFETWLLLLAAFDALI